MKTKPIIITMFYPLHESSRCKYLPPKETIVVAMSFFLEIPLLSLSETISGILVSGEH